MTWITSRWSPPIESAICKRWQAKVHHWRESTRSICITPELQTLPENYEERMKESHPDSSRILLFVLDPYDLVLSKLSRNTERDREDVKHLSGILHLDPNVLRARYDAELNHV